MKIKVLLVDDHSSVRHGLRKLLSRSPKIEIVGEAGDGRKAIQLTKALQPDVMLLDVEMPGMNGYEVARQVSESGKFPRILALSGYNEKRYILGMFANGAVGYITKEEAPEQLLTAVDEIAAGKRGWISENVARILGVPARPIGQDTIPALTSIEKEILRCIVEGKTDAEISVILAIDLGEVQRANQSINMKLGVKSRLEAIVRAMQEDLV